MSAEVKDSSSQLGNTDEMRMAVTSDRRLFTYYNETLKSLQSAFNAASATHDGDIERSAGKVSKVFGVVADAFESIPVVGGAVKTAASVLKNIFGFANQAEIERKHDAVERLSGDLDPQNWTIFAKELALKLTMENADQIKASASLDPSKKPNNRSALSEKDRKKIEGMAKDSFQTIVGAMSELKIDGLDEGKNIEDPEVREEAVSTLTRKGTLREEKAVEKDPAKLAKMAVAENNNYDDNHPIKGPHSELAVRQHHSHDQAHR